MLIETPSIAPAMHLRVGGRWVESSPQGLVTAYPDPSGEIVVLLHGLCETETSWRLGDDIREPYADRLAHDLGLTPVLVRYNSGLRISDNGAALGALLADLVAGWPVPLTRIVLIGHSMGGLVIHSALAQVGPERRWPQLVTETVSLGSPHHGSPVARGVHRADAQPGLAARRRPDGPDGFGDARRHDPGAEQVRRGARRRRHRCESPAPAQRRCRLLRRTGIEGISPRTWHPVTTIVDPSPHAIPDLVERRFDTGEVNRVWTSDITYLATGQGWLYLCAIRDGCSRRVLGYAFSDSLHTDLVEDALRRAVTFRHGDTHGVILHADRSCQYTSQQLHDAAEALNVRLSVGRTGVCLLTGQSDPWGVAA